MEELTIIEIKTAKQKRDFLNFPLKLYKNNPYFVPPLYADEKKIFNTDYIYNDTCDSVFFGAYRGKKMVGRISGIIQKASNKIRNEKRLRFTRFDSLDEQEIANGLFAAVEKWAREREMDTVCGPLGYSDLEREGLLIEGFDQLSTFEEQYNADYYGKLIENCGYGKEVDWIESKLRAPKVHDDALDKSADFIMRRYKLHFGEAKNVNEFIKLYADGFFKLLDVSYADIYGTVPFTEGMKKMMLDNFKLIISLRNVAVILDENDNIVCLGICFPSIASAIQKSKGHLTPAALIKLLKAIKHPKILDLGLVGVDPAYENRGISMVMLAQIIKMLSNGEIEYAETNLNLETNYNILNAWRRFDAVHHKRRRSYIKKLSGGNESNG